MDTFSSEWNDFQKELDETINAIQAERHEEFLSLYKEIVEAGVEYLNYEQNQSSLSLLYETFIYFLTHEEYAKCARLRKILDAYKEHRYPFLKAVSNFIRKSTH